jgi:hypothetical protein
MPAHFNESKLQNSYHSLWEGFYAAWHGLNYEVYIPGKEEVFVGFDVGFSCSKAKYKLSSAEFFEWIKWKVKNQSSGDSAFLYAYFLQYKLLEEVNCLNDIKSSKTKIGLSTKFGYSLNAGAYRGKLDTVRKTYAKGTKKRQFSQHEALCRLASIREADVAYCFPRYTSSTPIPNIANRKLGDLMRVSVDKDTPRLRDTETHYLYFKSTNGTSPAWCSNPKLAYLENEPPKKQLFTPIQIFKLIKANYVALQSKERRASISIEDIEIQDSDLELDRFMQYLNALPDCTRIMAMV